MIFKLRFLDFSPLLMEIETQVHWKPQDLLEDIPRTLWQTLARVIVEDFHTSDLWGQVG